MRRIFNACLLVTFAMASCFTMNSHANCLFHGIVWDTGSIFVPEEVVEISDDIYPYHSTQLGDQWAASSDTYDPGIGSYAYVYRPVVSTNSMKASVAFEVIYTVVWHKYGHGTPSPLQVDSQGSATATVYSGVSILLDPGPGGDFSQGVVSGDISVSASTVGHSGYFSVSNSASISQTVSADMTHTTTVRLHPTAGLTISGEYRG